MNAKHIAVTTVERLGYHEVEDGVECDACQIQFFVRPKGFAVEGSVLRSHRRHCPVAPMLVEIPGVCDA